MFKIINNSTAYYTRTRTVSRRLFSLNNLFLVDVFFCESVQKKKPKESRLIRVDLFKCFRKIPVQMWFFSRFGEKIINAHVGRTNPISEHGDDPPCMSVNQTLRRTMECVITAIRYTTYLAGNALNFLYSRTTCVQNDGGVRVPKQERVLRTANHSQHRR